MKNKNILLLVLLFLVCILSISAISATENTTNKDVISADNNNENNLETNIQYDDVSNSKENIELKEEENNNNDKVSESETDKTLTDNNDELSFTNLNTTINNNTNSTIYLSNNYKYNNDSDTDFIGGIVIERDLTIYGNGVTIDGNKLARIFNVSDSNLNVNFYNINFINGNSNTTEVKYGGAIYGGNSYNCTFTNNNGSFWGGAIAYGNAYNCTFTSNYARWDGGAIAYGNAYDCTFNKNQGLTGAGGIYIGNATNCIFTENFATGYSTVGGAMESGYAYNCTFINNTASSGGALRLVDAYNCTFINNNASNGGAINVGNAYNCTFINNTATEDGGAICDPDWNRKVYNCTFINNKAERDGGAILKVNAYNCTFINNTAVRDGGAIKYATAENCTFTNNNGTKGGAFCGSEYYPNYFLYLCTFNNNTADLGQAMYYGNAILCIFNGDTTENTTIIPATINVLNYTSHYGSGERLKFNLTARNKLYDGINTTINIYKDDGSLVKTVYGLTGEGWVVDLDVGNYTAELSLTDYPNENSTNATINVMQINTTVGIDPIANVTVEEPVLINFTTTSNSTNITVKVNGTEINGTFVNGTGSYTYTPNASGVYNVTVEVAANEYYNAGYNETTFTVAEKINATVEITPIANVTVEQPVLINFTTTSNSTNITVKVNGTEINGTFVNGTGSYTYTPNASGIYNVTVEVAENKYYTAGYNETTFTVADKINTTVEITPIVNATIGQPVLIEFNTTSNSTNITVKVNGEVITPTLEGYIFTPDANGTYNVTVEVAENEYYTAGYNETTFTVEKINTTVVIKPIIDAKVGKEIQINYTTNSNGTVTIKVNGDVIADGKFTPTTNDTYYVTIEIAENDYYTQATNETSFKAKKIASTIIANPVTTNYNLDKYLTITLKDEDGKPITGEVLTVKILGSSKEYATDSNGQIKIKVPTSSPKTYNANIKYAGSNQFKASTASIKVTVKKATPKITAKSAKYKLKAKTKKYTITIKNQNKVIKNKGVTLKINGKTYTAKTNNKGQATFTIKNLNKKGTYNAVITVMGNHYYNQVSKKVKINVKA